MRIFSAFIIFLSALAITPALAETTETGWLELVEGFKDELLGAEVASVSNVDDQSEMQVEITLPRVLGKAIEEVVVIGKRSQINYNIELDKTVEVIKDFDAGRSGLVIHLGKDEPVKLLINYIDYNEPKF